MQYIFNILIFLFSTFKVGIADSNSSDGCGKHIPNQPHNGHSHRFYVHVNDPNMGRIERNYLVHVPLHFKRTNDVAVPLILDYHGWYGTARSQQFKGGLSDVADEETEDTFIIVHLEGAGKGDHGNEVINKGGMGSWNVSRTNGPLGAPCQLPRPEANEEICYKSCPSCDESNSCDFSACYDDIEFTKVVVDDVSKMYCIDMDSIHMSGISNGGMFMYYAAAEMSDIIATIAPISGSPFLGFDNLPHSPISVIDFHGTDDDTIPYDANSKHAMGVGPYDTVISWDYYYYPGKPRVILDWTFSFDCGLEEQKYPTPMDGVDEWTCSIWSNCRNGAEIVHCNGNYGHDYPFGNEEDQYIGGSRILWNFMKSHKRNMIK